MNSNKIQREIESSNSASFWLKKAICTAEGRDVLDALRDAETLLSYCKQRAAEAGLMVPA